MPGRSLQVSPTSLQRVRNALTRRSLIQQSLVDEGIASWSTINKFFTGKPVARSIFMEICHYLDLDWEDIVVSPNGADGAEFPQPIQPEPVVDQPESSPLLKAVQACSAAAREALTPRILERIPRAVVREKYLPAIARGLQGNHPRIIPIVAPAGYGKSTILGDLYDELTGAGSQWVGLVLCSTLSLSVGFRGFFSYGLVASTFSNGSQSVAGSASPSAYQASLLEVALGESLCGQSYSVVEVAQQLVATRGKGVLLIDTLDLVINREATPVFNAILKQLLSLGITVVFTCRDHEYNDYLEPTRERMIGVSQFVDRHSTPNFTTAEIRQAAETFFQKLDPAAPEQGQAFADQILALSADNRSLLEIIQNPLLLALLCDLFAKDGTVPPDLTVSKLYRRYWQEKVAYSRLNQQDTDLLAIEKENLCLAIAQVLFERSQERLAESLYRDELGLQFTETLAKAYDDLLSEGVIELLPSRKLHFFHQTLLEYAIAYWLTRHSAQPQRQQLIQALRLPEGSLAKSYWLPVLRQLLTIVESEAEFDELIAQLNTQDLGVFGAVVLASISRDQPNALRRLLPTALELGEAYQRRLRQAINSAPRPLIETVWDMLLTLLEQANHTTAGNTAQLVGDLLARWWHELRFKLPETLNAISRRKVKVDVPGFEQQGDRALFAGWLLQPCLPLIQENSEVFLLETLQTHLSIFGYGTSATIIQLHASSNIPTESQQALLKQLLQFPIPKQELVERAICDFLAVILPKHVRLPDFPLGDHWSEILYQNNLPGWHIAQAKAVGRWIATDKTILSRILNDLVFGDPQCLGQVLIALTESIRQGASSELVSQLVQLQPERLDIENCKCLGSLLIRCAAQLRVDDQERLAQWLLPFTREHGELLSALLDVLADTSSTAKSTLEQLLDANILSSAKQTQVRNQLLRFQPITSHPPLNTFDKTTQRFLVNVYRQQAANDPTALQRLLEASQGSSKEVALCASKELDQVGGSLLTADQLFPLLRSPFPGVRANVLSGFIQQVSHPSKKLTPTKLSQVCQITSKEEDQTVSRLLCDLIAVWVRQEQEVPPGIIEILAGTPNRLLAKNLFDGGTARSMMDALKAIAQSEHEGLAVIQLKNTVRKLLTSIHLKQVRNSESEMIDLLSAMHRLDHHLLHTLIDECCPLLAEKQWHQNISAILKTVRRIENQNSPLLEKVHGSEWCTPKIRSIILEIRGY